MSRASCTWRNTSGPGIIDNVSLRDHVSLRDTLSMLGLSEQSPSHLGTPIIATARTLRFRWYALMFIPIGWQKLFQAANYGEQLCSDNLTTAIIVTTIQETIRHFFNWLTSILEKAPPCNSVAKHWTRFLKKWTFNSFLDSRNDNGRRQIVAVVNIAAWKQKWA